MLTLSGKSIVLYFGTRMKLNEGRQNIVVWYKGKIKNVKLSVVICNNYAIIL